MTPSENQFYPFPTTGKPYANTMRQVGSIQHGTMEVRRYEAIFCRTCGVRVRSKWIPQHCPNAKCPSNASLEQAVAASEERKGRVCSCGAGAGPFAISRHDPGCPLRGVNDRHLHPRWRRVLRWWK